MEHTGRKRFFGRIGLAAAFALSALASSAALAGIANTKHNLGSGTGPAGRNQVAETDEICVFCHTPHGGDTSNPAPLWNKRLNTGGVAYTTYQSIGSSTMNARFANDGLSGGSVGSVSLACLSCHDGTQAMDNIINAPGSGGFIADGGGTNGLAWTWTGPNVNAQGFLTGVANLTKDLSNDHPIGIQYCGGGPTVATPGTVCRDGDFVAPQNGSIGGATAFWVDTPGGAAGTRDKNDMILYNRTFPTDGVGPSVECATCHDPHAEDTATRKTFLRIANSGSAVCLACHVK